jgi:hypothetical protein
LLLSHDPLPPSPSLVHSSLLFLHWAFPFRQAQGEWKKQAYEEKSPGAESFAFVQGRSVEARKSSRFKEIYAQFALAPLPKS